MPNEYEFTRITLGRSWVVEKHGDPEYDKIGSDWCGRHLLMAVGKLHLSSILFMSFDETTRCRLLGSFWSFINDRIIFLCVPINFKTVFIESSVVWIVGTFESSMLVQLRLWILLTSKNKLLLLQDISFSGTINCLPGKVNHNRKIFSSRINPKGTTLIIPIETN